MDGRQRLGEHYVYHGSSKFAAVFRLYDGFTFKAKHGCFERMMWIWFSLLLESHLLLEVNRKMLSNIKLDFFFFFFLSIFAALIHVSVDLYRYLHMNAKSAGKPSLILHLLSVK